MNVFVQLCVVGNIIIYQVCDKQERITARSRKARLRNSNPNVERVQPGERRGSVMLRRDGWFKNEGKRLGYTLLCQLN